MLIGNALHVSDLQVYAIPVCPLPQTKRGEVRNDNKTGELVIRVLPCQYTELFFFAISL